MVNLKDAYRDQWGISRQRERKVKELLESWGFKVWVNGFGAMSIEYILEKPSEKGIPDLLTVTDSSILFFEVTGTAKLSPLADIWVRIDKMLFAKKYAQYATVFIAHCIDDREIIRFIDITSLPIEYIEIVHPTIRDNVETYYKIPISYCLSKEQLAIKLKSM